MAKFSRIPKLSKESTEGLIVDLCEAIALTNSKSEAAELLTDLLGKQELEMIAKRLRVAELLLDNYTYQDIFKEIHVSPNTVARVQAWLRQSGDGYRKIIEKTKSKRKNRENNEKPFKLSGMKKKYPMYYWPQIMLEHWIKSSSQKDKQEMRRVLLKLQNKAGMYKELDSLLKAQFQIKK